MKQLKLIFTLLTLLFSWLQVNSAFADIYPPPVSAIQFVDGKWVLVAYTNLWKVDSVSGPSFSKLSYRSASFVQNPPATVLTYYYGSNTENYVTLVSKYNLEPDTTAANNNWQNYPGNMWICYYICPLKTS